MSVLHFWITINYPYKKVRTHGAYVGVIYLTVWMNQWQQSNHNKPVCSWLWRLECLRQEQIPDTKGRLKDVAMPVYWWNICWTMAEQLILYCNRFFFFFGHQENVGMCYLLCREKKSLVQFTLLVLLHRLVDVWLHTSSSTPSSRPYGKGPMSLWHWRHLPHYAKCCPTEGLVSMPPNKSLVTVSWQNETFQPPRKPTIY